MPLDPAPRGFRQVGLAAVALILLARVRARLARHVARVALDHVPG